LRRVDEHDGEKFCFKLITPLRVFFFKGNCTLLVGVFVSHIDEGETQDEVNNWIDSMTSVCGKLWEEENKLTKGPVRYCGCVVTQTFKRDQ
jgi:hypothetical protein